MLAWDNRSLKSTETLAFISRNIYRVQKRALVNWNVKSMMDDAIESIRWKRTDLSSFLVHLTKCHEYGGNELSAFDSLKSILREDENGVCKLVGSDGSNIGLFSGVKCVRDKTLLKSVCFTEAPLDQIKHFEKLFESPSKNDYSSYGLVFEQKYIREMNGNPCFYVNTLGGNSLKMAIISIADLIDCINDLKQREPSQLPICVHNYAQNIEKIFPYFNIYGPAGGYADRMTRDYYWEREWRVPGDLNFKHEDVFCGLCEDEVVEDFSIDYPKIPFICPEWNNDKILKALRDWSYS